jgi:hypothetical protein
MKPYNSPKLPPKKLSKKMGRPAVKNWRGRWLKASAENPFFAKSRAYKAKKKAENELAKKVRLALRNATLKGFFE